MVELVTLSLLGKLAGNRMETGFFNIMEVKQAAAAFKLPDVLPRRADWFGPVLHATIAQFETGA